MATWTRVRAGCYELREGGFIEGFVERSSRWRGMWWWCLWGGDAVRSGSLEFTLRRAKTLLAEAAGSKCKRPLKLCPREDG